MNRDRTYLVLYDPLGEEATLPIATGLPDGEHVARFVAHGGWNQWALASFTVRGDATTTFLTSLREWAIPAGLVVGVLALLWLFWLIRRRRFSVAWDWTSTLLRTWIATWQSCSALGARPARSCWPARAIYSFRFLPSPCWGWRRWSLLLLLWPHGGLVLAAAAIPFFVNPPQIFGFSLPGVELIIWLTALALMCARVGGGTPALRSGASAVAYAQLDRSGGAVIAVFRHLEYNSCPERRSGRP